MISLTIPDRGAAGYTLYAAGNALNRPVRLSEKGGYCIAFEGTVMLFYTYRTTRRAFIVTEDGAFRADRTELECLMTPVKVILEARGRKVDLLKKLKYYIEKNRLAEEVYGYPAGFWRRIALLAEKDFDGRKSALSFSSFAATVRAYRSRTPRRETETSPLERFCP